MTIFTTDKPQRQFKSPDHSLIGIAVVAIVVVATSLAAIAVFI